MSSEVTTNGAARPGGGHTKRAAERYSLWSILRHGLSGSPWQRVWRSHDLAPIYDVVIIGGGVHGLSTAYYLAKNHGINRVAILEKNYIGSGASRRAPRPRSACGCRP